MSALVWPLSAYTLTSPYGSRSGGFHYGDDLAAPLGTPIHAAGDGTVAASGSASGFGQWIVIDHIINGQKYSTVYGHMYPSGVYVHAGQIVKQGDHIADVGSNGESTGPHCHFEVWQGGRLTGGHAVDPASVVGSTSGQSGMTVETVGDNSTSAGNIAGSILVPGWGAISQTGVGSIMGGIINAISFMLDPHNWWRAFLFLLGIGILGYVLWSTMNGNGNG